MPNPLFNGNSVSVVGTSNAAQQSMIGNIPVPPQVMETIKQIMGMVQSGADFYTVAKALKSKNITPEAVERGLYLAMPQLRDVKKKISQMGIDPKAFIGQIMKENNISQDELKGMIGDLAKKFTKH